MSKEIILSEELQNKLNNCLDEELQLNKNIKDFHNKSLPLNFYFSDNILVLRKTLNDKKQKLYKEISLYLREQSKDKAINKICYVCKYSYIVDPHHIIPIKEVTKKLLNKIPIIIRFSLINLCPTHHRVFHQEEYIQLSFL